eukprot:3549756-Prymnesium_polylepis.1
MRWAPAVAQPRCSRAPKPLRGLRRHPCPHAHRAHPAHSLPTHLLPTRSPRQPFLHAHRASPWPNAHRGNPSTRLPRQPSHTLNAPTRRHALTPPALRLRPRVFCSRAHALVAP